MAEAKERWKLIGSSVAGTSHAAAGIPCQDAHAYELLEDDTLLAAVADGAGSAKYAGQGASLAVQSAVEYLSRNLQSGKPASANLGIGLLRECVMHVRARLKDNALKYSEDTGLKVRLDDFAATLLIVFVTDAFLGAAQIGDGATVYRERTGTLVVACKPEHGEYLNETCFITSQDFENRCQLACTPSGSINALSMFSDGLQMLALNYRDYSAHGPFFNPLFKYAEARQACVEELHQFLVSDRVCAHSDDDKTLILAVRTPVG